MTVEHTLKGLLEKIKESLQATNSAQIVCGDDHVKELLPLYSLAEFFSAKQTNSKRLVVVFPSAKECGPFLEKANLYLTQLLGKLAPLCLELAPRNFWGSERMQNHFGDKIDRIFLYGALSNPKQDVLLVTTLQALQQKVPRKQAMLEGSIGLTKGLELDLESLLEKLRERGYQEARNLESPANFSVRGGIVDIFPTNLKSPVRVEFFGDTLQSIRQVSLDTMQSVEEIQKVVFFPASQLVFPSPEKYLQTFYDYLLSIDLKPHERANLMGAFEKQTSLSQLEVFLPLLSPDLTLLFEYFTPDTRFLFPKSLTLCEEASLGFKEKLQASYETDLAQNKPTLAPDKHYDWMDASDLYTKVSPFLELGNPQLRYDTEVHRFSGQDCKPVSLKDGSNKKEVFNLVLKAVQEEKKVSILVDTKATALSLIELFALRGIEGTWAANGLMQLGRQLAPLTFSLGEMSAGFVDTSSNILILSHRFFRKSIQPKTKSENHSKQKLKNLIRSFQDLKEGSCVVHSKHGVGRYHGLVTMVISQQNADFLHLSYYGGDKLYLPVDKIQQLQKYTAANDEDKGPTLDRLGGVGFEKKKALVQKNVQELAEKMLQLHAQRKLAKAYRYQPPGEMYHQFVEDFPYEETPDQWQAIEEVNADMESDEAMDRIIVGDVGFGKTEVALRAAMRCILEGFQVVVLVPTTILAMQHYATFRERLSKYGTKVAQIHRFISRKDQTTALEELHAGKLDCIIGTHRLLSKDVLPKKLGLLIVDEEQKFGVVHKEQLRVLRAQADVLTLTATPIPRTLHMAVLGLRAISIIATPPPKRLAIKTTVTKQDDEILKEAVLREIHRGGQVFVVHNRVDNLQQVQHYLHKLLGPISIAMAHGQMEEGDLEEVILSFMEQKAQVLLCTTIIESGIDMPNVNTLIVLHAERFGLAQLYQLRGRVGRSTSQAYSYFFTSPHAEVSEEALERLEILSAKQELGAGFFIASHDMEIRGVGNLLGAEQSGHVSTVGFDMYTDLLNEAINKLLGLASQSKLDTEIKLKVEAFLPANYVTNESERLQIYQRVFAAETQDELQEIHFWIRDRFGPLPLAFTKLLYIAEIKMLASGWNVLQINRLRANVCELKFAPLTPEQVQKIHERILSQPNKYSLTPEFSLLIHLSASHESLKDEELLIRLKESLE